MLLDLDELLDGIEVDVADALELAAQLRQLLVHALEVDLLRGLGLLGDIVQVEIVVLAHLVKQGVDARAELGVTQPQRLELRTQFLVGLLHQAVPLGRTAGAVLEFVERGARLHEPIAGAAALPPRPDGRGPLPR